MGLFLREKPLHRVTISSLIIYQSGGVPVKLLYVPFAHASHPPSPSLVCPPAQYEQFSIDVLASVLGVGGQGCTAFGVGWGGWGVGCGVQRVWGAGFGV